MNLALVVHPDKPDALRALGRVRACVDATPHRLLLWEISAHALRRRSGDAAELRGLEITSDLAACDAVVSLGGDGTLLRAVRGLGGADRPLLGINLGSLGFLTDVSAEELETALQALLAGRFHLDSRMLLQARPESRPAVDLVALNEIVIHGARGRVLEFTTWVAGRELGRTLADGVIVATPSGSTAYSLSAGGPVLSPRVEALVVTPISPHSLTIRPLVVGADETIEIIVQQTVAGSAALTVDGQPSGALAVGERLIVQRAARDLHLVTTHDRYFYDTLRTKLGWGSGRRGRAETPGG